jgi:hypothetical protein
VCVCVCVCVCLRSKAFSRCADSEFDPLLPALRPSSVIHFSVVVDISPSLPVVSPHRNCHSSVFSSL